jgi:NAD(P)-dependent dehydrogenase (short-subunit alcohol dehydrogenase family)
VSDFDLSGRVAIVTGGNGGIGLGMADALARAGCAVSIWGRNEEKNAHALAQLRAHGGAVDVRQCDDCVAKLVFHWCSKILRAAGATFV